MSITVPLEGFGRAGGTSLNFDVKAYATKNALLAATPKENTIGIITTTAINGWVFSAVEPESPAEGMVWITTGTSSTVEFNALKKNAIQVYPLSAKQYVDGAWVDVTAMSYQGGAWVEWIQWLYKDGNQYTDITGGWDAAYQSGMNISFNEDIEITWLGGTYVGAYFHTKKPIDLTNKSWVSATGLITNRYDSNFPMELMVCKELPVNWNFVYDSIAKLTVMNVESPIEVDVRALSGEYYILCNPGGVTGKVSDIKLV